MNLTEAQAELTELVVELMDELGIDYQPELIQLITETIIKQPWFTHELKCIKETLALINEIYSMISKSTEIKNIYKRYQIFYKSKIVQIKQAYYSNYIYVLYQFVVRFLWMFLLLRTRPLV